MLRSRTVFNAAKRGLATFAGEPAAAPHPVRNFLVKFAAATSLFYVGGVALSVYNDQFEELFTDNVPLAEPLVDFYQSYRDGTLQTSKISLEELKLKFGELSNKVEQIPNAGATSMLAQTDPAASPKTKAAQVLEDSLVMLRLPQVPPVATLDTASAAAPSAANHLVDSVNEIVASVNAQSLLLPEDSYNAVTLAWGKLTAALQQLTADFDHDVAQQVARRYGEASVELEHAYDARLKAAEVEITQRFLDEFANFKAQLEKHSSEELACALQANEQALLAKQSNEVALLSIKQVEEFNKILSEKLDQERQGRLAKLEELNTSVANLTQVVDKVDVFVKKNEVLTRLTLLTTEIRDRLQSGDLTSVQLDDQLSELKTLSDILPGKPHKCCTKTPHLLDVLVAELDQLAAQQQILSNEQLYNRWSLLQDDLKTASLLPPNSGILGHLSAKFFSLFLFNKSGSSVENDMDSVIARVSENLRLANLENAVEEVVNLKGWPRVLCDEWVHEARKKLEVETLVDALDCEVRTL
ncbi:LAFE_0H13168g1_1 [Lachancea fermentati]|uniref:MICOS complex subunit MIC60 n=1 Tax=Lachancea fermentati TaxID=4955 RepID=A0A1G4MKR5_LACFM|nr:LAFE_0H13168g1_1 [Lachancea fermentati]